MKLEIKYTKKTKIHEYVGIKQHAKEQPMGQKRNKKRNQKNTLSQMKMEIY